MTDDRARLWALLRRHGLVASDVAPAREPGTFWFVRLLLGFGGWLGAVFLLGFVAAAFSFVVDKPLASFIAGALACLVAAVLLRKPVETDFLPHFAFAVSLAGQALMAWGLASGMHAGGPAAFAIAAQQAVLLLAVPNALHRIWTSGTAAVAVAYGLHALQLGPYASFLLTAAVAWIWLKEFDLGRWAGAGRAAGYGISIAAVAVTATAGVFGRDAATFGDGASGWLGAALGGAVLPAAAAMLLRREGMQPGSRLGSSALIIALILGAAAVKAPGLAPAMVILVLGFANGNRVLAAFGIVALLAYLSHYYYSLQATLLEKSALLAATGMALLLAKIALTRAWKGGPRDA